MVFVNKLDRAGADFARCVREVGTRLRAQAIAVNVPLYDGEELVGVVDLVGLRELRWDGEGPSAPVVTPAVLSDNLMAARDALLEACAEHSAEVVGDIGRRGGQVLGLDVREADGEHIVRAEVPLARSFGYAGALSGLTHGRGRFALEPLRYEPVPSPRARAAMM
jgi:translation elongation factor EF-G